MTFDLWGHPRSKIFSPFESPYMTFYPTSIDTFSLSRTVFEIFGYRGLEDIIRVYSLPFSSMTSQMNIFAFKRFYTLQGFRKYKNEISSSSNSSPKDFIGLSRIRIPYFRFKSGEKMSLKFFIGISRRLKQFKNEVNSSFLTQDIR